MTVALRSLSASLLVSTVLLSASLVPAADVPTTCYVLDGTHNSAAGYRCDNSTTGHSSCCAIGAICYSNGVCQQSNVGVQDYLRVGCTDRTWKDPACLDQCTSFAPDSTAGIRFCNGAITSTNQYCCDNGTFGVGSFACCQTPDDIFVLKPVATFVAQIPLSYTSTSTSASSTATSASTTTSPASTTASSPATTTPTTAPSKKSGGGGHGVAIGLGVGIPLFLIAVAIIAFFLWRHYHHDPDADLVGGPHGAIHPPGGPEPREVPGSMPGMQDPNKGYYGGRVYGSPQELPVPGRFHELPTPSSEG